MNNAQFITLVALLVNTLALVVVIYQTCLAKRGLSKTTRNLALFEKVEMLRRLPENNHVLWVVAILGRWLEDMEEVLEEIKVLTRERSAEGLSNVGERKGLKTPQGLIQKKSYELMPEWLQGIWLAAAQHYYNAKAPIYSCLTMPDPLLCLDGKEDSLTGRILESIRSIEELLLLIDDMMPPAYLNAPASLRDKDFFEVV